MSPFLAHLRKEWRDHRAVALGVVVAVPVLVGGAFLLWGDSLAAAGSPLVSAGFVATVATFASIAVVGDAFAGECRRGTLAFLRRLPGGMRHAFAAKVTFHLAFVGGVSILALALLGPAWRGVGIDALAAGTELGLDRFPDGGGWPLLAFALALGAWPLMASTWLGRSGASALAGLVLLVVAALPAFLCVRDHPYFLPSLETTMLWISVGAVVVALLSAGVAFRLGRRFDGRPVRPFVFGAAVALVLAGGVNGYGAIALERWLHIDPHDEDFRIEGAIAGTDARHLFVTVFRGRAWRGSAVTGEGHERGTPLQAWVVETATGAWRAAGVGEPEAFAHVWPLRAADPRPLDPVPALVSQRPRGGGRPVLTWWDATTAEKVATLPGGVRSAGTDRLTQAVLRATTTVRDALGRRVWMRRGHVEHEDETTPFGSGLRAVRTDVVTRTWPIAGGWLSWEQRGGRRAPAAWVVRPDGRRQPIAAGDLYATALSLDYQLVAESRGWAVRRFGSVETLPANRPPEVLGPVVDEQEVLAVRQIEPGYARFVRWNPLSGEDRPVAVSGDVAQGVGHINVSGRTSDGRLLLTLSTRGGPRVVAVYEPGPAALRVVGRFDAPRGPPAAFALLDDGALLAVEGGRRIVRLGPEAGAREVLFPR